MANGYSRYYYQGPVCENGKLVMASWYDETVAKTQAKAISNMVYHFKKGYNKPLNTKIVIDPKYIEQEA